MNDLDGRVVLVTGASTGLGAAFAIAAASRGARAVIVNYARSDADAESTAEAVRSAGAEALLAKGDVADADSCTAIAAQAARFGRIDGLINNAGINSFAVDPANLDALTRADFDRVFAVNVWGAYQMVRATRRLLEASDNASVLMMSSITGVTGLGPSAYAASKGAINTLTLSLARALAPKIRVNALCPGTVNTRWWRKPGQTDEALQARLDQSRQRTPLKAISEPEDVAEAGLFFLTHAARHITGETLLVDSGLHLGAAPS